MVSRSWLATVLAVGQLSSICNAQVDVPSINNFRRRVFARASVIGHWVYYDGGEVSQVVDGTSPLSQWRPSNPTNTTLSIDLTKSWTAEDVEVKETSKSAPKMMRQAIFTDNSSASFYIWGGFTSYGAKLPAAKLWHFTTDGSGGGQWGTVLPHGNDVFTALTRSQGGAFVSTKDSGFYFGGFSDGGSDPHPNGPVPGFLQFNYSATDTAWTNNTASVPYSDYGTLVGATAHYAPFGPNGLIMIFGGGSQVIGNGQSVDNVGYLSFSKIFFMDPVTKEWYSQQTSGNAPGPRMWHCTVGVQGPNNTYEIFMHGGSNIANKETFDEVYILSLPGFVWQKANYTSRAPRDTHSCVVAGQRQMITFGGVNRMAANGNSTIFFNEEDPFRQGVGVFDLTALAWKDQYEPTAATYDSPDAVKAWYNEGNLANVQYSSGVEALINYGKSGSGSSPGSGSGSKSSNTGAIAGGVVGGVAGVALIVLAAFFLMRRRKHRKVPTEEFGGGHNVVEAPGTDYYNNGGMQQTAYSPGPAPSTTAPPSELQGEHRDHSPFSAGDMPLKMMQPPEMDAREPRHFYAAELDGTEARK
ncbi:kelch repeat protein [Colletotrichum orchidophilum]|uniref:Kelch repeat protein n=1 Tax=Colletotrichum orchidophilum TaxID=1209926 RepID=A0A1G4BBG3_9PEZI|nr:kelch repeat protein [Colletotrichum orchidophilum]OHE98750.1 kelch repeat protein [Colletotrichum orchidophilum]